MLNIILFKSSSLISCQILVLYSEIRKTLPIMIVLLQPNLRTLPSYSCINSISTILYSEIHNIVRLALIEPINKLFRIRCR